MTATLLVLLIIFNVPVFLVIAWLVFDTKESAAETIWETVLALLQILLVPRIVRVLLEMDDSGAYGLFPIGAFFIFCIAVIAGEWYLLSRLMPTWFPWAP